MAARSNRLLVRGRPVVVLQHPTEAVSTTDGAVRSARCGWRKYQLVVQALVVPFVVVVGDEFEDRAAQ